MLEEPMKLFSTSGLARRLSSSPSAVIARLKHLEDMGILKTIQANRIKLYRLNTENPVVTALIEFYARLKEASKSG